MKHILVTNIVTTIIALLITSTPFAMAQTPVGQVSSTVSTSSEVQKHNIAPGTALPVYVQLLNFGTPGEQVDTLLHFGIRYATGELVLERTETVAVQTTASFTRYIDLPENMLPGTYTLTLDVEYRDQKFPAISEQQFTVEEKFFGYAVSEWYASLPFAVLPLALVAFFYRRRRERVEGFEKKYEYIEPEERFYYEIIHDILKSLRYHVGRKKLGKIIASTPGLEMSRDGMHIISLNEQPEVIIASLMKHYEAATGVTANVIINNQRPASHIM